MVSGDSRMHVECQEKNVTCRVICTLVLKIHVMMHFLSKLPVLGNP